MPDSEGAGAKRKGTRMKITGVGARLLLGSVLGALLPLLLAGSGGSYGSGGNTPPANPTVTSVAVSCKSTTVNVGQTSQCSATVQGTGSYSSAVNWSVNSAALYARFSFLIAAPNLPEIEGVIQ